jgi:galactonate dehydratase
MIDVPFAIGEEFASKWQFLPYIEEGLTNFARIDICNVGGFTEAMKVAGWAEAHYIDIMPHDPLGPVCTAASVHLCAAVANMAWLETRPDMAGSEVESQLQGYFRNLPALDGTGFPVPSAPGLGIELVDEDLVAPDLELWEPPHYRRADGSYTNW